MVEVINLGFEYLNKPVFEGVHFSLDPGTLLHLRGANGSGKTTLIKLLTGLLEPSQGDIRFQGQSIYSHRPSYQQAICFVGHKTGVSKYLTVREQCRFDLYYQDSSPLDELIHRFDLKKIENMLCGYLSVGQVRRVALIRLLLSNAQIWLLDEALVGLDERSVGLLMDCLSKKLAAGGQVILTSHQTLPPLRASYLEYSL